MKIFTLPLEASKAIFSTLFMWKKFCVPPETLYYFGNTIFPHLPNSVSVFASILFSHI